MRNKKTFLSFLEAREFARSLGIKTKTAWHQYSSLGKRPNNIPAHPKDIYKNLGWISYEDWLGCYKAEFKEFPSDIKQEFETAGYVIKQQYYKNIYSEINCVCPKGHDVKIKYCYLIRSKKSNFKVICCPYCANIKKHIPKSKLTWDKIIEDIKNIILPKYGYLPTRKESKNKDLYGDLGYCLDRAIYRIGGYNKVRKYLGLTCKRPNKFWQCWDNVKLEISKYFDLSCGVFPTYAEFKEAGINIYYICKSNNLNLAQMAEKFNCTLTSCYKCRDGHFVQSMYEVIVDEYLYSRGIPHEIQPKVGKYRADFLINDFYVEVWGFGKNGKNKLAKFYNNKRSIKEKYYNSINIHLISIECELFHHALNNLENICDYLDGLFKSYGFDVSPKKELSAKTIADARFDWRDDVIIEEIKKLIHQIGKFPSFQDICDAEMINLKQIITERGGINYYKKLMGYPFREKINWSEVTVLEELLKYPVFPKTKFLAKERSGLLKMIYRYGGVPYFRDKYNLAKNLVA